MSHPGARGREKAVKATMEGYQEMVDGIDRELTVMAEYVHHTAPTLQSVHKSIQASLERIMVIANHYIIAGKEEAYLKGLQDKTTEMVKVFERLKLEVDVCVCECGEKWSETDIAEIIDQTLKQLQEEV